MGLTGQEVAAFEEYFYHIMAARGSGEHALRDLLRPLRAPSTPWKAGCRSSRCGALRSAPHTLNLS